MEIPYTVEERPDTGFNNATLGIWLFLSSEIMLFGALFSSYILLRSSAAHWPSGASELNIPLATLNTFILVFSSIAVVFAWAGIRQGNLGQFKKWMGVSLLCGLGFLIIKSIEYNIEFTHHNFPSTSTFLALYFTMTALHAMHIIGGLIVNGYLWGPGSKMFKEDPNHFSHRVEVAGIYWHFVDLLWIILLFPTLYLL